MIGLTEEQVQLRVEQGLTNKQSESGTKSEKEIIQSHVFTYFNIVFLILAFLLLIAGKFKDMTFLFVIIANTCIGTIQEIKSKRAIDKMKIIASKKVIVYRNNREIELDSNLLVKDDVIRLQSGSQIPADATVIEGKIKVNESLLTGEEDDITKQIQDTLYSGSVVTSGTCKAVLTEVGDASYASKLRKQATSDVKQAKSEMMASLDKLIQIIGFLLIPIGILLFFNEFVILQNTFQDSIQSMVAALIGMIPEGLYLLTSVALAASVLRLSKKKVLVRSLDCVETLARIDTLCVDKTGTITESGMQVETIVPLDSNINHKIYLTAFSHAFTDENETLKAIKEYYPTNTTMQVIHTIPFSSSLKYSAAQFQDGTKIVVGAPQFIYPTHLKEIEKSYMHYIEQGYRVVLAGIYTGELNGKKIDDTLLRPFAAIVISNQIRNGAKETFQYFGKQGVNIKVISGDDAKTVSQVAIQAGISHADEYVNSSDLKDEDIEEAVKKYTVFGRTTPQQKMKMVQALKKQGHHVAMTGDGVNDILALKEADCGIAMASGTDAACQMAHIVLLESDFSSVPSIVGEGRRVINNIERSAQLFLAKNIFSLGLSIFCLVFSLTYPLKPIQLSLISTLTIGIPGFFLALQPNEALVSGSFIKNVLYRAFPGGLANLILVSAVSLYAYYFQLTNMETNTMAVTIALIVSIGILYYACLPLNTFRKIILGSVTLASFIALYFFSSFFYIGNLSIQAILLLILFILLSVPCMTVIRQIVFKIHDFYVQMKEKFNK